MQESAKATMGIVIKSEFRGQGYMKPSLMLLINHAKDHNVKVLADSVPSSRKNALSAFYDLGFIKVKEYTTKKFNHDEIVYEIEKRLF